MTSNMDWYSTLYLNYGHNVTFNFDYVLTWFNDNFVLHEKLSCSIMCDSLRFDGLEPTRLLHPWTFPGKSTGVGFHFLFQGLFPTQGGNPGLPYGRHMIFTLSHQESPHLPYICNHSLTYYSWILNSVQSFSPVWLFETPWTAACQASLSITNCDRF